MSWLQTKACAHHSTYLYISKRCITLSSFMKFVDRSMWLFPCGFRAQCISENSTNGTFDCVCNPGFTGNLSPSVLV